LFSTGWIKCFSLYEFTRVEYRHKIGRFYEPCK
jgi:hypothetical protein